MSGSECHSWTVVFYRLNFQKNITKKKLSSFFLADSQTEPYLRNTLMKFLYFSDRLDNNVKENSKPNKHRLCVSKAMQPMLYIVTLTFAFMYENLETEFTTSLLLPFMYFQMLNSFPMDALKHEDV